MALEYVGGTSGANASEATNFNVSLTSLTGGIGSAPIEGDIVVIVTGSATYNANVDSGVATAGYTEIADLFQPESYDLDMSANYKIMGVTPDTTVEIISDTSTSSTTCAIQVWRGVDPVTPLDVTSTTNIFGNSGSPISPPNITTVSNGCVILSTAQRTSGSNTTLTSAPAGFSNAIYRSQDLGNATASMIASKQTMLSGLVEIGDWTLSAGGSSVDARGAITIALRPEEYEIEGPVLESWTTQTGDTTITLTKPSGVEVGDLLVLLTGVGNNGDGPDTPPTGWTFLMEFGGGSPDCSVGVFYKVADGTEGATETLSSFSGYDIFGFYLRISGVDTSAPITGLYDYTFVATATSLTVPDATTTVDNALVVGLFSHSGDGTPFSMTGVTKQDETEYSTVSAVFGIGYKETFGSIGDVTASSGDSDGYVGVVFSIAPQTSISYDQALTVTAEATPVNNGINSLLRTITVTAEAGTQLVKKAITEIVTTAEAGISIIKKTSKEIVAQAQANVSLQAGLLYTKSVIAQAQANTEIIRKNVTLKILTATAQANTEISNIFIYGKELLSQATATISMEKGKTLSRIITATAEATAEVIQSGLIISRTLMVVASATITRTVLQALSRTLTATGRAVTSILKDYGYIDKYPENDTSYEDKYPE